MKKTKTQIYAGLLVAALAVLVVLDHLIISNNPDILGYSMERLGEKLVEMVPEGKDAVRGLYNQFVSQVEAKEVSPEQVEMVAANILNLSNQNATLSPDEAQSFLALSLVEPESRMAEPFVAIDSVERNITLLRDKHLVKADPLKKSIPVERLKDLGERLDILINMNELIRPKLDEKPMLRYQIHNNIIRVYVDPEVKRAIPEKELRKMDKEFSELQKKKMLYWRENLSNEAMEMARKKKEELDAIRELKQHENHEKLRQSQIIAELRTLETLKNLEVKGYTTALSSDSLRIKIEKEIKKAIEAATPNQ